MGTKTILLLYIVTTGCLLSVQNLYAQSPGDFRSNPAFLSTTWTSAGNWQRYTGTAWVSAGAFPTSSDGVITIRNTHTIDLSATITLDQVVVETDGTLNMTAPLLSTITITINNGVGTDLQVNGTLSVGSGATLAGSGTIMNNGALSINTGATLTGSSTLQNNIGGTVSLNGGTLGVATTNAGTMNINSLLASSTLTSTLTNNGTLSHLYNTLTINNGGSIINNNLFNFPTGLLTTTITSTAGAASVTNTASGVMTTVATGVAIINAPVSFTNQGIMRGVGEFRILSTSVTNTGTIEPGTASIGTLTISPQLVNNKTVTYSLDIATTGNVPGTTYDEVVISNQGGTSANFNGSTLRVTDQAGDPVTTTVYTLIRTSPGTTLTGTFSSVVLPPTLGTLTITSTTVTVQKIAVGKHWVASTAQNWNTSANWSLSAGGTGGAGVPTSIQVVYFDNLRNGNCTIDISPTVSALVVNSGYTGTIAHTTQTITTSGSAQFSGGTFSGGSGNITIGGAFSLSGTSFTSTSAILELRHNAAFTSGAFNHNNGTVRFNAMNVTSPVISGVSPTLYNVEWTGIPKIYTLSSSGVMTVANSLTLSGAGALTLNSGTIALSGNAINNNTGTGGGGTTLLTLTGTGVQALPGRAVAGQGAFPVVTINKGSGSVNLSNVVTVSGSWTQLAGSVSAGSATLQVGGNFTSNAAFSTGTGTVVLNGASVQNITSNAPITFHHLTITNTAGTRIQSNQNLTGVLTLGAGAQLDADGTSNTSIFTLLSTADSPAQDAAVAQLPAGAQVNGNITVQRYMSLEGEDASLYRYISMPIQNATVADLQQELPVNGPFPGASTCSTCIPNARSLFYYDETVITNINGDQFTDLNDGYRGFPTSSTSETFQPGRGYALYVYGTNLSTARWDVRGQLTQGNSSSVTLPVTFTSSGSIDNDGWNLVGNPYACAIDWNAASGWSKTNIDASIYIRDNGFVPRRYTTWNGAVGINGGSRYIAMGQAFWIKTHATAPVLSANEQVKVVGQSPSFFRRHSEEEGVIRLTLQRDADRDETVIHLRDDATPEFDAHADAVKWGSSSFDISSLSQDVRLAINSLAVSTTQESIPLNIDRLSAGVYELHVAHSLRDGMPLRLVDQHLQDTVVLDRDDLYAFSVTDISSGSRDRFVILVGDTPGIVTATKAIPVINLFPNPTSGEFDLQISSDMELQRADIFNAVGINVGTIPIQHSGTQSGGSFSLKDQPSGCYFVRITTSEGYIVKKMVKR